MIDSELTFKKLGLMGRFQIVSCLYVVHSRGFDNLSFVDIRYLMNTHQELDEILEISNTFLLPYSMLSFQFGFVLTLEDERSSWRHIKKY